MNGIEPLLEDGDHPQGLPPRGDVLGAFHGFDAFNTGG
jgi:hypothetical protein